MASKTVLTGTGGKLKITATESAPDATANESDVRIIAEIYSPSVTFGSPMGTWTVKRDGSTIGSGSWSTTSAAGWEEIYDATITVAHDPDGSGEIDVQFSIGATGTSGVGGPASVTLTLPLETLTVVPLAPTGLTATRVSDTQASLAWTNNAASNGAATTQTIQQSVNGGAFGTPVTIAAAASVTVTCAANRKTTYRVRGVNAAGVGAYSSASAAIYTTPAAPTGVTATKVGSDIVVAFNSNVGFSEHTHVIEHGVVSGGSTTWDGSPLATVASGTETYTHTSPNAAQVHVYRVFAKNTDTAALASSKVTSNTVQLLVAPNAPTIGALPTKADKTAALVMPWTHNPADTTAQTAYEVGYSTNGGSSWSTTGKVTSTTPSKSFAGNTYAADVTLTLRVRTWGQATSGGSDGTGASAWSSTKAVTFKTNPVATVTTPAASSTHDAATLTVVLGFTQAESATFVSATIKLYSGATLLETVTSTALAGTLLATRLTDGGSYSVKATVVDSNGLTSAEVTSAFTVDYTDPVAATVTATYVADSGVAQIGVTVPAASVGEADAVSVTITRTIDGVSEVVVEEYPAEASFTILDMTPTIHGTNVYTVTTISADGAESDADDVTLVTEEVEWAFMSKGASFDQIIRFGGELKPQATPTVDAALVKAAGRSRPIGLYGTSGGLVVSGTGDVVIGLGSSAEEIEAFLLLPGKGCYRDPSGRRMFGLITGQVSRDTYNLGSFAYSVTETS